MDPLAARLALATDAVAIAVQAVDVAAGDLEVGGADLGAVHVALPGGSRPAVPGRPSRDSASLEYRRPREHGARPVRDPCPCLGHEPWLRSAAPSSCGRPLGWRVRDHAWPTPDELSGRCAWVPPWQVSRLQVSIDSRSLGGGGFLSGAARCLPARLDVVRVAGVCAATGLRSVHEHRTGTAGQHP